MTLSRDAALAAAGASCVIGGRSALVEAILGRAEGGRRAGGGDADALDEFADVIRRRRCEAADDAGDREVEQASDHADALGLVPNKSGPNQGASTPGKIF